jgi:hypothetical protein
MKYLIILAIVVLAWCPWFKKEEALSLVEAKVVQAKISTSDICPLTIHYDSLRKVPLGYTIKVSYDCTQNDPVYGVTQSTEIVYIIFSKQVIGVPVKHVRNSS